MNSFTDLGLSSQMVEACEKRLSWFHPTEIQTEVIPIALQGKDVFAISPPRSGKGGAFVLPILHALLEAGPNLNTFFACVLSPTTDLAVHINSTFFGLGSQFGVKCALLVESYDMVHQSNKISQQPHIIVGTPGQIIKHLRHTQGFSLALSRLKYLVIDDVHLLLNHQQLYDISEMIPSERTTFLFSSTLTQKVIDEAHLLLNEQPLYDISEMTPSERRPFLFSSTLAEKVHTIQSVCLRNPVKIDASSKYSIVDTLQQQRCSMQARHKDCYLVYTLTKMTGKTSMVFTRTCGSTLLLALTLKNLGIKAIPIIVFMSQAKKLESLNAFKSGDCNILLCSDKASRGLDIPAVDTVIHYNVPINPNDYLYRVRWTAHPDVAISLVSPDEARRFNMIETLIGFPLPVYPAPCEDVLLLQSRASDAERIARKEIKEFSWKTGGYLEDEEVNKIQRFSEGIM